MVITKKSLRRAPCCGASGRHRLPLLDGMVRHSPPHRRCEAARRRYCPNGNDMPSGTPKALGNLELSRSCAAGPVRDRVLVVRAAGQQRRVSVVKRRGRHHIAGPDGLPHGAHAKGLRQEPTLKRASR